MRAMTNTRRAAALVGVMGILAIAAVGLGLAATNGVEPVIETGDAGVCPADWAETEGATELASPPGGNPCKDCKTPPGPQHLCTRISCDPCCWACVGEPYPICSS